MLWLINTLVILHCACTRAVEFKSGVGVCHANRLTSTLVFKFKFFGCLHADRLKITLASSYAIARLALSCTTLKNTYATLTYGGKSMLHWCKREVAWGAKYLLKTHQYSGSERPAVWGSGDKFVVMVRCIIPSSHVRASSTDEEKCIGQTSVDPTCKDRVRAVDQLHYLNLRR
jgi:hypothetical protein